MKKLFISSTTPKYRVIAAIVGLTFLFGLSAAAQTLAADNTPQAGERLISIHDRGVEKGVLTTATTVRKALTEANIAIADNDLVEPGLDEELVANSYHVNIYRARPVVINDNGMTQKVLSAHQMPKQIAQHAGIVMHDEDQATMSLTDDIVSHGVALQLDIDRATAFTLVLYGKKTEAYSQETTVDAMINNKGIKLGKDDTVSVDKSTALTSGMTVEIWRNGIQTVNEDQDVAFPTEKVQDADREVGYRQVKTPGENGKKTVTYEIVMKNGIEESRKEIQSVTTVEPKKQVEVVGAKTSGNPLTKSMGVSRFTDSNGVVHRETYYDLPMATVMRNCGSAGLYTVRTDGAKVDKDGYVIIAAHLGNYPRCSVVQTSLGLGKVYDTGGFVSAHPHGFDLATDWTNYNGV